MAEIGDVAIGEIVSEVVRRLAPEGCGAVAEGTLLRDDLGYDSLALVELAFALEELFQLPPLPEEESTDAASVGDVAKIVASIVSRNGVEQDEAALRAAVARIPGQAADPANGGA